VSLPQNRAFLLGVQWHPEWDFAKDSLSRAIFAGFGASL
jgi:putative glutamine amidotransferase